MVIERLLWLKKERLIKGAMGLENIKKKEWGVLRGWSPQFGKNICKHERIDLHPFLYFSVITLLRMLKVEKIFNTCVSSNQNPKYMINLLTRQILINSIVYRISTHKYHGSWLMGTFPKKTTPLSRFLFPARKP